jgi:ATP-dependent RNA helicase HrpA
LSGEREIRDTAEALAGLKHAEVLPLYAPLPTAEQQKVFAPHIVRCGRARVGWCGWA